MTTIINTRADLDAASEDIRGDFIEALAASIYHRDADGETVVNASVISRFGFTPADFPDAPVAEFQPDVSDAVDVP